MRKAVDPRVDREDAVTSIPEDKKVKKAFAKTIVLDLSSPEEEYRHHMIPTERLLDCKKWMMGYVRFWQNECEPHPEGDAMAFFERFDQDVVESFTDYKIPVIDLDEETPAPAVCTVFDKVNTGGVTLTTFELVTAKFAGQQFRLREDWYERRHRLRSKYGVLQSIEGEQFLQAVTLLATQAGRRKAIASGESPDQAPAVNCKKQDVLNLSLDEYKHWAGRVGNGFEEAAKFLHTQYVFTKQNVPYNTQLIPLASLYVELGQELRTGNALASLARWYWSGIFGEEYGSATETQFALDLVQVANFVRSGIEPRLLVEANFAPERLVSLRTRNSAAYKGLYALQMKNGAADWKTGDPLSLMTANQVDIHHIFPVAWCERKGNSVPPGLYQSVINKTPIDAITNRVIGSKAPSQYCARLDQDTEELDEILRRHWITPEHLRADSFADLFLARGQKMLGLIGQAMGKPMADGAQPFRRALDSAGIEPFLGEDRDYDDVGYAAYAVAEV